MTTAYHKGLVEVPTLKSLYSEMRHDKNTLAVGTAFFVANDQQSHCALLLRTFRMTAFQSQLRHEGEIEQT
jgi:hypothetical protein